MSATPFRIAVLVVLGAVCLALGGCATPASAVRVRPWERAALADSTMNPDRDPLGSALSEHVYFSREAASGGRGVGGSGCGCN
jgi:hypothetical protein